MKVDTNRTDAGGQALLMWQTVFTHLLQALGPQGWWPAEDEEEVVIGAVLTQAVAWTNVERAIGNLRREGLLRLGALAVAPLETVRRCIRPTGYFNVKAEKLRAVARYICGAGGLGALRRRPPAENRRGLLGVWGIGPETADAILCYALHQPAFVADAYARRVLGRMGLLPSSAQGYEAAAAYLAPRLPDDADWLGEFHALLVAVGKRWCRPRTTDCARCPALPFCAQGGETLRASRQAQSGGEPDGHDDRPGAASRGERARATHALHVEGKPAQALQRRSPGSTHRCPGGGGHPRPEPPHG